MIGFIPDDPSQRENTMAKSITIFGTEVNLTNITISIVAIGRGYTVTAVAMLDEEDVLYAATVFREEATLDEAAEELAVEAIQEVKDFLDANK